MDVIIRKAIIDDYDELNKLFWYGEKLFNYILEM